MEIPTSVLDGAGGVFSQYEIKKAIYKYCSTGAYPVVHSYGTDISISGVVPGLNTIRFDWDTHSGIYYDIYYSQNEEGPWTQSSSRVYDNYPSYNRFTLSGLLTNAEYWVSVVPGCYIDEDYYYRPSQFIGEVEEGVKLMGRTNRFKSKTVQV
jgi:hypothetical protein